MPKFFEQRYIRLGGPFTAAQFVVIRTKQWELHHEIGVCVLTHNPQTPYCDVYISTKKKDLAPFGRKIVAGFSSIIMAAITYAGYINIVK